MKRFIAIGLLSVYLFSATEFSQLLKIPFLVTHYLAHKTASNLSFVQFITLHYAYDQVRDADYDKDMKLPFKTHETSANTLNAFIQPFTAFNNPLCFQFKKAKYLFSNNSSIFFYHSSIWQPPKFVKYRATV